MRMPQSASGPATPGDTGASPAASAGAGDATASAVAAVAAPPVRVPAAAAGSPNGAAPGQLTGDGEPGGLPRPSQFRELLRPSQIRARLRRPTGQDLSLLATRVGAIARVHWLATILLGIGLVLRVLTQLAYHPAIIYIDSLKYLYGAWPGSDPVGYKVPLKLILGIGDLGTVTLVQHLVGLGMAVTIYAVLIRRGTARWLGALAMAPVLFDAYQLQAEQMIMPDIWFEAVVVAGLAVLLWQQVPGTPQIVIGCLLLGASTGVRQVGEILVVPAVLLMLVLGGGWRQTLRRVIAAGLAFGLAIFLYLAVSAVTQGRPYLSRSSASLTYGRMAAAADCATLKLPAAERPLCPTPAQQAMGADWLDHANNGTLKVYEAAYARAGSPAGPFGPLETGFNNAVETQQPLRVISAILGDSAKLFAPTRHTSPGDTPIWRWQFQTAFPTYEPYVLIQNGQLTFDYSRAVSPTGDPLPPRPQSLDPSLGGAPQVNKAMASFLRSYQLGGGYTPGPLLALFVITGLAGSVLLLRGRRLTPSARSQAQAALAFFTIGLFVLAVSDAFEFTWRYQLPAVVTLPPAGALGIGALIALTRRSSPERDPGSAPKQAPELATPAP